MSSLPAAAGSDPVTGTAGHADAAAVWSWRLETADGHVTGRSDGFDSQSDAETWLGAQFGDLLDHGVDQVVLLQGDAVAYGPMSLHEA